MAPGDVARPDVHLDCPGLIDSWGAMSIYIPRCVMLEGNDLTLERAAADGQAHHVEPVVRRRIANGKSKLRSGVQKGRSGFEVETSLAEKQAPRRSPWCAHGRTRACTPRVTCQPSG